MADPTWMDLNIVPLVYVAGPFAAANAAAMHENIHRACTLSLYAVARGLSPLAPHLGILAGAYGLETAPGGQERGIRVILAQVEVVAQSFDGRFWAIRTPDGGLSSRTHRAMETFSRVWRDRHGRDPHQVNAIVARTWSEWMTVIPKELYEQAKLPWDVSQVVEPYDPHVSRK